MPKHAKRQQHAERKTRAREKAEVVNGSDGSQCSLSALLDLVVDTNVRQDSGIASNNAMHNCNGSGYGDGRTVVIKRWSGREKVFIAVFGSASEQQKAMQRLSLYLEDPVYAGQIVTQVPYGRAANSYSGHNMRMHDIASFATKAPSLSVDEYSLLDRLQAAGALVRTADGNDTSFDDQQQQPEQYNEAEEGACLLTVARSADTKEAKDALRHEAVHGVFYTDSTFRDAVERFWNNSLREHEREAWKDACERIGYNTNNPELVKNEFAAYMLTERNLSTRELAPCLSSGGKKRNDGVGKQLEFIQRRFLQHVDPNSVLQ